MSSNSETLFEAFLNQHDHEAWAAVLTTLMPHIHEVDRTATQIWFYFYPLALARTLQQADDPAKMAQRLWLKGNYYLKDQIDRSHEFLYGHRYWLEVKKSVFDLASSAKAPASLELATQIKKLAGEIAGRLNVSESLLVGITSVAFMTLQQVGMTVFRMSPGKTNVGKRRAKMTPEQVLAERAKDNSQGVLGFLRTVDKRWQITFNENDPQAQYTLIDSQDLAMGAANDKRDYRSQDPRCIEGPIPVECRSAACGTCWVGILGGAEKLGPVSALERRKIREFGYINSDEARPLIRLACMTPCYGAVSIVIPPWNGVFGRQLEKLKANNEENQGETINS